MRNEHGWNRNLRDQLEENAYLSNINVFVPLKLEALIDGIVQVEGTRLDSLADTDTTRGNRLGDLGRNSNKLKTL